MADAFAVAEVRLWGKRVGAVAEADDGTITFEYEPAFAGSGLEISPIKLPLSVRGPVTFPELHRLEAFLGLPGVLADALPDKFGNAIITKFFTDRGRPADGMRPVQKLLYIGSRAMGALEFRPQMRQDRAGENEPLIVAELVKQARKIVEGAPEVAIPEIMRVGASAGGARPKALLLWNRATGVVRSAFAKPTQADEHWIIKFDGVGELGAPDPTPQYHNRVEFVYSRLARDAGIDMPDTELLVERRLAHLMVRRFDRDRDHRMHMHTLGGLHHADHNAPGEFSYEQYLRTILTLGLGYQALEEAFRRVVFNIAAVNQDDHVKNFGFLMDETGQWRLAPAYDLTHARGAGWTRTHQVTLNGKRDHFTRDDLLGLGGPTGLRKDGAEIVDQVVAALGSWERYAKDSQVPGKVISAIAEQFRLAGG